MSARTGSGGRAATCPRCGAEGEAEARFCEHCGMPLVLRRGEVPDPPDSRRDWVRKVKPQLAEGRLVRVAGARNLAEAEFIQGLLLEAGVPSLIRRSAGFDVPDFLAAGPRDVMVPESGVQTAREVLLEAEILTASSPPVRPASPGRLLVGLLVALCLGVLAVWLLSTVLR
jgi:hypothetical protein